MTQTTVGSGVALLCLSLALALPACSASQGEGGDAGIDAFATSADSGADAPRPSTDSGADASVTVTDTGTDAFVSATDTGTDAFVSATDAGTDAFVAADTGTTPDANVDAGIACAPPFAVCNGTCVNPDNDIHNCGSCNNVCGGAHPFCNGGTCGTAPCTGATCGAGGFCCGGSCCTAGQLCCDVPGPISSGPRCTDPVGGTCPMGCPLCVCASPDTLIATPSGERRIADLAVGDLVYSADDGTLRAVPIAAVHQTPVSDHRVVRVTLETGRVLEISPGHPTADGRWFGDLRPGDRLDGVLVLSAELVPYTYGFTYDILPASDTGTYVAGGALIGSTLAAHDAPIALDLAQH